MNRDVTALIEQDHRDVEQLFARLQSGQGDQEMLFQTVAALLNAHSRAEEAEVYPVIAKAGEADEVKHAREEHAKADQLLAKLQRLQPGTPEFNQTLTELITGVSHHIEEEESTTLPALRAASDAGRLDKLAQAFLKRRGAELMAGSSPRRAQGSGLTKDELYAQAQKQRIPGRASMTKQELAEAVMAAKGN